MSESESGATTPQRREASPTPLEPTPKRSKSAQSSPVVLRRSTRLQATPLTVDNASPKQAPKRTAASSPDKDKGVSKSMPSSPAVPRQTTGRATPEIAATLNQANSPGPGQKRRRTAAISSNKGGQARLQPQEDAAAKFDGDYLDHTTPDLKTSQMHATAFHENILKLETLQSLQAYVKGHEDRQFYDAQSVIDAVREEMQCLANILGAPVPFAEALEKITSGFHTDQQREAVVELLQCPRLRVMGLPEDKRNSRIQLVLEACWHCPGLILQTTGRSQGPCDDPASSQGPCDDPPSSRSGRSQGPCDDPGSSQGPCDDPPSSRSGRSQGPCDDPGSSQGPCDDPGTLRSARSKRSQGLYGDDDGSPGPCGDDEDLNNDEPDDVQDKERRLIRDHRRQIFHLLFVSLKHILTMCNVKVLVHAHGSVASYATKSLMKDTRERFVAMYLVHEVRHLWFQQYIHMGEEPPAELQLEYTLSVINSRQLPETRIDSFQTYGEAVSKAMSNTEAYAVLQAHKLREALERPYLALSHKHVVKQQKGPAAATSRVIVARAPVLVKSRQSIACEEERRNRRRANQERGHEQLSENEVAGVLNAVFMDLGETLTSALIEAATHIMPLLAAKYRQLNNGFAKIESRLQETRAKIQQGTAVGTVVREAVSYANFWSINTSRWLPCILMMRHEAAQSGSRSSPGVKVQEYLVIAEFDIATAQPTGLVQCVFRRLKTSGILKPPLVELVEGEGEPRLQQADAMRARFTQNMVAVFEGNNMVLMRCDTGQAFTGLTWRSDNERQHWTPALQNDLIYQNDISQKATNYVLRRMLPLELTSNRHQYFTFADFRMPSARTALKNQPSRLAAHVLMVDYCWSAGSESVDPAERLCAWSIAKQALAGFLQRSPKLKVGPTASAQKSFTLRWPFEDKLYKLLVQDGLVTISRGPCHLPNLPNPPKLSNIEQFEAINAAMSIKIESQIAELPAAADAAVMQDTALLAGIQVIPSDTPTPQTVRCEAVLDAATNQRFTSSAKASARFYHWARYAHAVLVKLLDVLNDSVAGVLESHMDAFPDTEATLALQDALRNAFAENDSTNIRSLAESVLEECESYFGQALPDLVAELLKKATNMKTGRSATATLSNLTALLEFVRNNVMLSDKQSRFWTAKKLTALLSHLGDDAKWAIDLKNACGQQNPKSALLSADSLRDIVSKLLKDTGHKVQSRKSNNNAGNRNNRAAAASGPVVFAVKRVSAYKAPLELHWCALKSDSPTDVQNWQPLPLEALSPVAQEVIDLMSEGSGMRYTMTVPTSDRALRSGRKEKVSNVEERFEYLMLGKSILQNKSEVTAVSSFSKVVDFLSNAILQLQSPSTLSQQVVPATPNSEDTYQVPSQQHVANPNSYPAELAKTPLQILLENALAELSGFRSRIVWRVFDHAYKPRDGKGKEVEEAEEVEEEDEEDDSDSGEGNTKGKGAKGKAAKNGPSVNKLYNLLWPKVKGQDVRLQYGYLADDLRFLGHASSPFLDREHQAVYGNWTRNLDQSKRHNKRSHSWVSSILGKQSVDTAMDNILAWVTTNRGKDIRKSLHRQFFPPSSDTFDAMLEPVWSDATNALRSFQCDLRDDGIHIDISGQRELQRTPKKSLELGLVYNSDAVHTVTSKLHSKSRRFSINAAAHIHRPYSSQLNYRIGAPKFKKADVSNDNDGVWLVMLLLYPFTDEEAAHRSMERPASQGTKGDNSSPPKLAALNLNRTEATQREPAGHPHTSDEGTEPAQETAVDVTGSAVVAKEETEAAKALRHRWLTAKCVRRQLQARGNYSLLERDESQDNPRLRHVATDSQVVVARGCGLPCSPHARHLDGIEIVAVDPGFRPGLSLVDLRRGHNYHIGSDVGAAVRSLLVRIQELDKKIGKKINAAPNVKLARSMEAVAQCILNYQRGIPQSDRSQANLAVGNAQTNLYRQIASTRNNDSEIQDLIKQQAKLQRAITNKVRHFHVVAARVLTTFQVIFHPNLKVAMLSRRDPGRVVNGLSLRALQLMSHADSLKRIEQRQTSVGLGMFKNCEAFSTRLCSKCGRLQLVGKKKIFECNACGYRAHRDGNGASSAGQMGITRALEFLDPFGTHRSS
ncbi:hypothetical protein HDU86_005195 [Geranomyces michiganensis]|nr:hypothetical protein HDU86_005195 [Geranomyces michiganensis]